ncbi:hypothetical protein BAUCODRAFT_30285 [Baudoinia panamericana UAMH 10762]|uniref:Uncharacterized protein n=1 Tax=Baudoinia panamericana (strain UAMH 10762) TaxID=717646 RepID=M2NKA9_BAUPA|nr:uncharacterized protein BAUCODRAFT_30285 [Baudoinia panamericana UAMH 10762]EMC99874.1 hypothetical protein BAUCODRAFT_30285 [Baudoinia panamericana UAMH 10762]
MSAVSHGDRESVTTGLKRTASNASMSSSEEITVRPRSSTTSDQSSSGALLNRRHNTLIVDAIDKPMKLCSVTNGMLTIKLSKEQSAKLLTPRQATTDRNVDLNGDVDDTDGRNARGTYSRSYKESHPEIDWVHRGQGRYLPADQIKKEPGLVPERRSSRVQQVELINDDKAIKVEPNEPGTAPPAKRQRTAYNSSSHSATDSTPQYGLRQRSVTMQSPSASELRSARLARRTLPSIEMTTPLRSSSLRKVWSVEDDDTAEEESDDNALTDAALDLASGRGEPTYKIGYVKAHPEEVFHHTGNGWYRRGPRPAIKPKEALTIKAEINEERQAQRRLSSRLSDGPAKPRAQQSIHKTDLHNWPGAEFHHKGNGWYKPGPDPRGVRASIWVPDPTDADARDSGVNDFDADSDHAGDDDSQDDFDGHAKANGTVDRSYVDAHPEIDFVHRGNGRFMRKSDVEMAKTRATGSATPVREHRKSLSAPEKEPTYTREYIFSHPDEDFYHTGNGRYKRGPKPDTAPANEDNESDESEREDDVEEVLLFSKEYVDAHPGEVFHHRGQGRYGRGPRVSAVRASTAANDDGDDEDEGDATARYDTAYVNAHPEQTFHHKGQGRWARGLPPPGSHNKIAIRGPGAKGNSIRPSEELEVPKNAPELTALVLKVDGPDKFPTLEWHYRGGGKWGRLTKQQYEEMFEAPSPKHRDMLIDKSALTTNVPKRGKKQTDGPNVQLARGTDVVTKHTAKLRASVDVANVGLAAHRKRKHMAERRASDRSPGAANVTESQARPQARQPAAKPRMLTEQEDPLDEVLPPIFKAKGWSPPPMLEGEEDPMDRQMRHVFPAYNYDMVLESMTKFDPVQRRIEKLKKIAANAANFLKTIQGEYLALDKYTAPYAKVPRKPAKGGSVPLPQDTFEDMKEADLYDYQFDPRRIGNQDPDAQKIVRDAEGRELRKRARRAGVEPTDTVPGWHFGEAELAGKRQSRQPNRFDGVIEEPARKRARITVTGVDGAESVASSRGATPANGYDPNEFKPPTSGRWAGHVPKRIQQLRAGSELSLGSSVEAADAGGVKKGRPLGSKNLRKRRDAGVSKGQREKKTTAELEELRVRMENGEDVYNEESESEDEEGEELEEDEEKVPRMPMVTGPDGFLYPA